ncbi:MAG TPA: hypothetical protein VKX17_02730 [Planctomycetota bacterium]|nr:hypothetical protein [Planctomycetota bacterium]
MRYTLLTCLCIFAVQNLTGGEDPPPVPNAALKYWFAFDEMPRKFNKANVELINLGFSAPAGRDRDDLVAFVSTPIRAMQRGAAIDHCDWDVDLAAEFVYGDEPQIQKLRLLTRAACVTARAHVDANRLESAAQLLVDILKLARHCGSGSAMLSRLNEAWIRATAIKALAATAPRLSAEQLKSLAARIEAFPPPKPLADYLRKGEKMRTTWLREQFKTCEQTGTFPPELADMLLLPRTPAPDIKSLQSDLDKMESINEEIAKASETPLAGRAENLREINDLVAQAGPLVKVLVRDTSLNLNFVERDLCLAALLRAGVRVLIDGEAAVAATHDRYNDGKPFTYIKKDLGFELQSRLEDATADDRGPVKLVFGFDPNEKPPVRGAPVKPPKPPENFGEF